MNGSKTNLMSRERILDAMKTPPPGGYYVWDGVDDDDRPATEEELREGIALAKSPGRPAGSDKTQIALRVDNPILAAFRATGKGWQTRMNEALKEWLKEHAA
jgi:uncharacterized protein (DUF4415 family)